MDLIQTLRARRAAIKAELEALTATAEGESRGFNEAESAGFDAKLDEMNKLDARIAELAEAEKREAAAAEHAVTTGFAKADEGVRSEPNPVYRRDRGDTSFFRDSYYANQSTRESGAARDRLIRSQETRALTTAATAGGTMAPPEWLVEDFVKYARPARVTADLIGTRPLTSGISSVNLPKISGGTSVGVTQTQNTSVSNTDITTTSVSSGITTLSGQQVVSLELLNQSGIPFDEVIVSDLAADYARQFGVQVLSGSGSNGQLRGLDSGSGVVTITYTTTQPYVVTSTSAQSFFNKVIAASNSIHTTRYLPAQAVIMTPTRWNWVLEALDTTNRPLITTQGPNFNGLAQSDGNVAQGFAGTFAGLPVYVDPNIKATYGAATNQDRVYVLRTDDVWIYETDMQSASFDATYANQNSVLFRVVGFSAMIPDRYGPSVSIIDGTGLAATNFSL